MKVELRALDLARRRAIVQVEDRLYVVAEERRWLPVPLERERSVSALAEPGIILVRRDYGALADLIDFLQDLPVRGLTSREALLRRLDARPQVSEPCEAWTRDFPNLIRMLYPRVDAFFAARRCPQEISFHLSVEIFHQLYQEGPSDSTEVLLRLWELAEVAYRNQCGETLEPSRRGDRIERGARTGRQGQGPEVGEALEKRRLWRSLLALDRVTLQCLYLWANSEYDVAEVATILHFRADRVAVSLDLVAAKLGVTREELRGPLLLEIVGEALRL